MSLYGNKVTVNGIPCKSVSRWTANGEYRVVFERESVSLEQIDAINWRRPKLSGPCDLPAGYGFEVKNIEYHMNDKTWSVTLKVREQYLGDVTGYQTQVSELEGTVSELEGMVAEQRRTIETKEDVIQTQEGTIQTQQETIAQQTDEITEQHRIILGYTASVAGLTSIMDAVAVISTELPDALALDMAELAPDCFPIWENVLENGAELAQGRVIEKDGQLYRVVQSVTPQVHQEPGGEGMLAIYRPIDREHAGTPEDPIPWAYGMDCLAGLYYSYNGTIYRVADGGNMIPCVWAPDTPGLWQWEKIEEAE